MRKYAIKPVKALTLASATCLVALASAPAWSTSYDQGAHQNANLEFDFHGNSEHLNEAAAGSLCLTDQVTAKPEGCPYAGGHGYNHEIAAVEQQQAAGLSYDPAYVGHGAHEYVAEPHPITGSSPAHADYAYQSQYQHLYAEYYGRPRVALHEVRSPRSGHSNAYKHHAKVGYTKPERPLSTFWSYIGFGTGVQRFTYEDKGGEQSLNINAGHLIAGVQYKKLFGVEARIGTGFGTSKGKFDCAPYNCSIELSSPLYAGLYGRVQYASKIPVTPYALLGVSYNKLTAKLTDPGGSYTETKAKYGFSYGAGLEFRANEKIRIGLEYLKHEKQLSAFGLNARYVF